MDATSTTTTATATRRSKRLAGEAAPPVSETWMVELAEARPKSARTSRSSRPRNSAAALPNLALKRIIEFTVDPVALISLALS